MASPSRGDSRAGDHLASRRGHATLLILGGEDSSDLADRGLAGLRAHRERECHRRRGAGSRRSDPGLASYLRIEERKLEAGGLS